MDAETEQKVQKVDELLTDILVQFPYPMRRGETDFWPALKELPRLDIAVLDLAMTQRKKPLLPFWKAFELVNRRWPKLKLVKRVKELIEHAHDRLKEIGESELERIRCKAFEGAPKAKRLLEYLEAIQVDANKTAEIDWQDYKELLFGPGNYRIACDAPEPRLRRSGFSYSSALSPWKAFGAHYGYPSLGPRDPGNSRQKAFAVRTHGNQNRNQARLISEGVRCLAPG